MNPLQIDEFYFLIRVKLFWSRIFKGAFQLNILMYNIEGIRFFSFNNMYTIYISLSITKTIWLF